MMYICMKTTIILSLYIIIIGNYHRLGGLPEALVN